MSEKRKTWLEKLVGKDKAEHVRADAQRAAAALDQAGVERKQLDEAAAAPPAEAENPAAQIAAKLAEQIWTAIGGDPAQLTQEKLAAILASVLQEATGEAEAEPPPTEESHMMEDKARTSASSAQADLIFQLVSDQGEIVKALKGLKEELAGESSALKDLAPLAQRLVERVEKLEAQYADRPRSASQDMQTVLAPRDKAGKEAAEKVETEIKGGLQGGQKTELGVRVKS